MNSADQSRFVDSEPPKHPRRVWDAVRCLWVEVFTVCRRADGPFAKKNGTEPKAQLLLFDVSNN